MRSSRSSNGESDVVRRSQVADSISDGQMQVARQQDQVRSMTEENEQLKREIDTVSGTHYDYVKADKLATLQGDVDALERRYQFEKMKKNDLTKRYQLARIDLLHSRKVKGGVYVEKEQADAVQRQVDILENRLDQALGKFNDALSFNKELRDQIDIIREERRVFQRVHKKMEDDLSSKKKRMAERIEQSNRDMDERDEYQREMMQIEQQLAQQQQQHNGELHELDVAMLEIKAMREDQTNLQLEFEAREFDFEGQVADAAAEHTMGSTNNTDNGPLSGTQAAGMSSTGTRRAFDGAGDDADDEARQAVSVLKVDNEPQSITDIISQIHEATQATDLDEVHQEYVRLGDTNFSLYKFINELTATKETLSDEIRDLNRLLREDTDSEAEQRRLIKGLEEQLAATEGKLEKMQANSEQLHHALALTAEVTEEVYRRAGCRQLGTAGNVPTDAKCTEANLVLFLGDIEERATHILCAVQRHHYVEERRQQLAKGKHTGQIAPAEGDTGEVDDEENALTATNDSPQRGELPPALSADEFDVVEVAPLMPTAPQTAHKAVSAKRLVKQWELPSANLAGGDSTANGLLGDTDDDRVMSHEELRKQMELRLLSRRERDERAQQRKRKEGGPAVSGRTR